MRWFKNVKRSINDPHFRILLGILALCIVALVLLIYRAVLGILRSGDALIEIAGVVVIVVLAYLWYSAQRKEAEAREQREQAIAKLSQSEQNLRSYVQQITRAQEEERLRIARELHDSLAQNLIALLHRMDNFLQEQTDMPLERVKELWGFHEQIKDSLQEIRVLSRDLRPSVLDDVGLLSALHLIVRELKTEYGIEASLKVQGTERRFPQEVEVLLFRVAQEALRNAGKHSHATNAEVSINFGDSKTTVIVSDNGVGFKLPDKISDLSRSNKLGLVGMEERVRLLGGTLEIRSEPGNGTSVVVEAPV